MRGPKIVIDSDFGCSIGCDGRSDGDAVECVDDLGNDEDKQCCGTNERLKHCEDRIKILYTEINGESGS